MLTTNYYAQFITLANYKEKKIVRLLRLYNYIY